MRVGKNAARKQSQQRSNPDKGLFTGGVVANSLFAKPQVINMRNIHNSCICCLHASLLLLSKPVQRCLKLQCLFNLLKYVESCRSFVIFVEV